MQSGCLHAGHERTSQVLSSSELPRCPIDARLAAAVPRGLRQLIQSKLLPDSARAVAAGPQGVSLVHLALRCVPSDRITGEQPSLQVDTRSGHTEDEIR